jgi:hypothetical protein
VVAAVVLLTAATGYLFRENRRLERALAAAGSTSPAPREPVAASERADEASGERRRGPVSRWFRRLRGSGERPQLAGDGTRESRAERRVRRQHEIRALLGRDDGETVDDYRARMVPLIQGGLARPRQELEATRRELEELAGVSDEQRAQLKEAFDDASQEALDLTNQAIQSGDLSPYRRNWSGILSFGGGVGAVLSSVEGRIGRILTPAQLEVFSSHGFEWGEYLGVNVPWEDLDPPPPPPGQGG